MKQTRRGSPRIPYDEAVCIVRADGGGRVFARAVNLGAAGIYVTSAEPCEIGTNLICSLLLPGGPRKICGRVVRLVSLSRGVGMAIAFVDMDQGARAAIGQLIERHQHDVFQARLRLGGFDQAVKCEAVLEARTVHLTAALPFLRLGADVGVVLGDTEPLEAAGVISRVTLDPACEDGVPRLSLDVELAGPQASVEDEELARTPPPTALPAPYGHRLPSVVLSKTLRRQVVARSVMADHRRTAHRPHPTAEIARRPRFTDWTAPPLVAAVPGEATQRLALDPGELPASWRWSYLLFLPVVLALAALVARAGI